MTVRAMRVLVTRPEPGNSATAKTLKAAGHVPLQLPFTQSVALNHKTSGAVPDAIAVTSANALRYLDPAIAQGLRDVPLVAVGDATARQALAQGFTNVMSADGNVADLSAQLGSAIPGARDLLYICGVVRKPDLEEMAARSGLKIEVCETYSIEKVSQLTDKLDKVFDTGMPDVVMFHSGVSAQIFAEWLEHAQLAYQLENVILIVISERVSGLFSGYPNFTVCVAEKPNEPAMHAALAKALQA